MSIKACMREMGTALWASLSSFQRLSRAWASWRMRAIFLLQLDRQFGVGLAVQGAVFLLDGLEGFDLHAERV